jgi:hypothetical protein
LTASQGRRRRATLVGACVAVGATLAAAGLAVAGGLTIYNSTDATDTREAIPERVFPQTPTGLVAAVDEAGALASVAVLVAAPSGAGGSIVSVPVSADASAGGDTRLPLDQVLQAGGAEELDREAEIALGLAIDSTEVMTADRLAALLEPLGPLEVELPAAVTNANGEVIVDQGVQTLDAGQAAAVLTARDPARTGADRYAVTQAVWAAVAQAVGDGADSVAVDDSGVIDPVLGPLLRGPVRHRGLGYAAPEAAQNPTGVDVVELDRIESALVFGQIAPGRMSAPSPALTFRIESPFDEVAVGEGGSTAQVAYDAIAQVLFVGGNVVSVSTNAGPVPAVTQVEVSDESLLSEVEGLDGLLGEIEVSLAEERIAGIDAVIRLGTSFLDHRAATDGG